MDTLHRLRHRLEDLELSLLVFLDLHDGCHVVAPVAVVRGTPNSHEVFILLYMPQVPGTRTGILPAPAGELWL